MPFTWDYRKTTKLQQYTSGKVKKLLMAGNKNKVKNISHYFLSSPSLKRHNSRESSGKPSSRTDRRQRKQFNLEAFFFFFFLIFNGCLHPFLLHYCLLPVIQPILSLPSPLFQILFNIPVFSKNTNKTFLPSLEPTPTIISP